MIGGAAEWHSVEIFKDHFTETETYFIVHLEDIEIYLKKANNSSFLINSDRIVTNNKSMSGKSIFITQFYKLWAYFRESPLRRWL